MLDAGLAKFLELIRLNWAKGNGLVQFDLNDHYQISIILGIVYQTMQRAEGG